jgi:prevent-host-death family protein
MNDVYSTYEAKAKLSEILRKVESGRVIRITRRGTPIAEVRPVPATPATLEDRIAELTARGAILPAKRPGARVRPIADRPGALERFLQDRNG